MSDKMVLYAEDDFANRKLMEIQLTRKGISFDRAVAACHARKMYLYALGVFAGPGVSWNEKTGQVSIQRGTVSPLLPMWQGAGRVAKRRSPMLDSTKSCRNSCLHILLDKFAEQRQHIFLELVRVLLYTIVTDCCQGGKSEAWFPQE